MPNHVHGIVILFSGDVGAGLKPAHSDADMDSNRAGFKPAPTSLSKDEKSVQVIWIISFSKNIYVILYIISIFIAPIAQMDRASDYESAGRGFKSSWARLSK